MLRKDTKVELLEARPALLAVLEARARGARRAGGRGDAAGRAARSPRRAPPAGVRVIVEGVADVRRKGRKVNALRSGDFLGEIALVTGTPRTATVTTTSPTHVLVITAPAFRSLLRRMPASS